MTTYTVAADGTLSPASPAFPQPLINDVLQPDGSFDTTVATGTTANVYIDDFSQQNYQFQSLSIGYAINVYLGGFFSTPSLTGTGNITGAYDPTGVLIAPVFSSTGGTSVDINGTIAVTFNSDGNLAVSAGQRLDIEGDFTASGSGTTVVAAGAELDLNSLNTASVSGLTSLGTLKITAPNTRLLGATALGGTVLVQGDAANGIGSGTLATRTTASGNGTYVAALDLRSATFTAPINSLTLGGDASVSFGSGASVSRFAVAGAGSGLAPLDRIAVEGTLTITGDGASATNSVSVSQAELAGIGTSAAAGANTIDFRVAASNGGATLFNQITVDANTTLRNDAAMTLGGQANATATTTVGATGAASGSAFINGAGARLTVGAGAALSVAGIQNAGTIAVAGNATFLRSLTNTGTIDVTAGTLALQGAVAGTGGTFAIENGATLSLDAASAQSVSIASGGTLRLSQPTSFTGTLQLPTAGARIDLAGITATAATVANGSIVVTTATGTLTFAETGLANGSSLGLATDGAGGSLLTVNGVTTPAATTTLAYRFFDSIRGTQFITTSATERQMVQNTRPDLVYEGVGFNAVDPATDSAAAPVYRFFDSRFGTHFYTSSASERDTVLSTRPDLVSEGIGFYEHSTAQPGDSPVYRFFDQNFGTHFYTASNTERANIVATRPDLIAEGVSFYAPSNAAV